MAAPAFDAVRPTPPVSARRRVLIVDDSAVARLVVQRMVDSLDGFEVVATAGTAEQALERLGETPVDVVLLDLELPGMGGIEALPRLARRSGGAPVIVFSVHFRGNAAASVRAMTAGASDTLAKPVAWALADAFPRKLEHALRRVTTDGATRERPRAVPAAPAAGQGLARPVRCLAIGASTGGLHALAAFFAALPRSLAMPILITQHLPEQFIGYFANQMAAIAGRTVAVAREGARIGEGSVLVAPGDAHLAMAADGEGVRVRLQRGAAVSGCKPSADPMLAAAADIFGRDAVGVVLSGMGRDGLLGAEKLAGAGGELLVQDSGSAVIWGMPGAIATRGLAHRVAPPAELAAYVAMRAGRFGWK